MKRKTSIFIIVTGIILVAEILVLTMVNIAAYSYIDEVTLSEWDKCTINKEKELDSYPSYSGTVTEIRSSGVVYIIKAALEDDDVPEKGEDGYYSVDSEVFGLDCMNNARIKIDDFWFRIDNNTYPYGESYFTYTLSVGDTATVAYEPSEELDGDNYVRGIKPYVGPSMFPLSIAEYIFILPLPSLLIVIATLILAKAVSDNSSDEKRKAIRGCICSLIMVLIAVLWSGCAFCLSIAIIREQRKNNHLLHALAPVIYLYPEEETEVNVQLDLNGEFTVVYPKYPEGGWTVTAAHDGTLTDASGRNYDYLYWEGMLNMEPDFSEGYCVPGEDSAEFLEYALEELGLNESEANTFIMYWLPELEANEYNVISFQTENYENATNLSVYPAPDNVIRVNMAFYGTDEPIEIAEQDLASMNDISRDGFTVVEWGGELIAEP